jgi:hypothetical protein
MTTPEFTKPIDQNCPVDGTRQPGTAKSEWAVERSPIPYKHSGGSRADEQARFKSLRSDRSWSPSRHESLAEAPQTGTHKCHRARALLGEGFRCPFRSEAARERSGGCWAFHDPVRARVGLRMSQCPIRMERPRTQRTRGLPTDPALRLGALLELLCRASPRGSLFARGRHRLAQARRCYPWLWPPVRRPRSACYVRENRRPIARHIKQHPTCPDRRDGGSVAGGRAKIPQMRARRATEPMVILADRHMGERVDMRAGMRSRQNIFAHIAETGVVAGSAALCAGHSYPLGGPVGQDLKRQMPGKSGMPGKRSTAKE